MMPDTITLTELVKILQEDNKNIKKLTISWCDCSDAKPIIKIEYYENQQAT